MNKIQFILFSLIITILLSSCGSIEPLSVSKVENVKLHSFTKSSASVEVTMIVKNPNRYRFKMVDNNLDLFLNNAELGKAKIRKKIVIPRKSEQSYTFLIETEFSRLAMAGIPGLINMFRTKQVEFKLVGDVKVRTMGVSKIIPLQIVERVNLSKGNQDFNLPDFK